MNSATALQSALEQQRKIEANPPQLMYAPSGVGPSLEQVLKEYKERLQSSPEEEERISGLTRGDDKERDFIEFRERLQRSHEKEERRTLAPRFYLPEEQERDNRPKRTAKEREARARELSDQYYPLETAIETHLQGLASFKSDIETLIKQEGKRAFWHGVWLNAFFFVLGLGVSAVSFSSSQVFALIGIK